MKRSSLPRSLAASLAFGLALPRLFGQTVPQPSEPEEIVELSPFTVNAALDDGYAATQTMSGTRLATSLRDVASVVSPLTIEYLKDIDATDLQKAILFTPGTDEDPRAYNSMNNNPVSTRIRGFQLTGNSQNYLPSHITTDTYNIDRIDINRGANSILYGIGSPAGGYSATTKNAQFRNFGEVAARWDENNSHRYTVDLNQQLIKNRLAVRVAVLTQDDRSFRAPGANRDDRLYAAVNLKLVNREDYSANLRLQGEWSDGYASVVNWQTPVNYITAWAAAGAPLWDRASAVVGAFPVGMAQVPNANNIVVVSGGGETNVPAFVYGRRPSSVVTQIPGTTINARLGVPGVEPAFIPGTTDLVPAELNYFGPARGYTLDSNSQTVFLEQTFFKKILTETSYYRQEANRNWIREGGGGDLRVDLLSLLPDGTPNPNVGRIYTQGILRDQPQLTKHEVLRFTASTELDLTSHRSWLGRHRFGLMLEDAESLLGLNDRYEVNLSTQQYRTNLVQANNRIVRRSYLFAGAGNVWQADTNYRDITPVEGVVRTGSAQQVGNTFSSGMANQRIQADISNVQSVVASLQSFFLEDRFLAFAGVRNDSLKAKQLDQAYIAANRVNGVLPDWQTVPIVSNDSAKLNDNTYTFGAIARPKPWLDLFYNQSKVLATGNSRPDVFNRTLPFPVGKGSDVGLRWSTAGGQLTGSISYYQAEQTNSPDFQAQTIISQLDSLLDGLDALKSVPGSGVPVADYLALKVAGGTNAIDTLDNEARGIDAELVYNPSPNWRISLKVSRTLNEATNVQSRTLDYFDQLIFPLEASVPANTIIPTSGKTAAQSFDDFTQQFNLIKYSREGTVSQRLSKYGVSAVTNYRFREGKLKGFSVGANLRWNSEPHVSALLDPVTRAFSGNYVMGPSRAYFGLNLGYTRKLSDKVNFDVRLGMSNVLDESGFEPISADGVSGVVNGVRPITPRTWSISTAVRF